MTVKQLFKENLRLGHQGAVSRVLFSVQSDQLSVLCCCCLVAESCLTLRRHGLQPTRLLCPWDFPGKSTGVGCHFLLQGCILYIVPVCIYVNSNLLIHPIPIFPLGRYPNICSVCLGRKSKERGHICIHIVCVYIHIYIYIYIQPIHFVMQQKLKQHQGKLIAPHSSTLAWKISWTEEPGGLQSMGLLRVGHD